MTAAEARKIATSITTTVNAKELKIIEDCISKAANRGELRTQYFENLSHAVVDELGKRGFVVQEFFDQRDGITITISW